MVDDIKVFESFGRKDIEEIIKGNIKTVDEKFAQIAPLFVRTGYYLRRELDEKMYEDAGFDKFEDYVKETYGKSRSWAKRMMQINEKFSIDGNNPLMNEQFIGYSVSHLQEMLYLTDEQLEEVTPEMTVKEIREIRKPVEEVQEEQVSILGHPARVYPEGSLLTTKGCGNYDCFSCHRDGCKIRQEDCHCVETNAGNPFPCTTLNVVDMLREEIGDTCQFVNEALARHRNGDGEPVPCCKECNNRCGYACRRAAKEESEKVIPEEQNIDDDIPCDVAQEEIVVEEPGIVIENDDSVIEEPESVAEQEKIEREERIEELTEETTEDSDIQIVKETLEKEDRMLRDMRECYAEADWRVRRQELLVGALANFVCKLEDMQNTEPEVEQPELPILKNMEQREQFVLGYKSWPVWCKNELTEETYYRYDLPDGSAIVVRVYPYLLGWRNEECIGKELFLLKVPTQHFKDGESNMTTIKEHLKNVQKAGD